MSCGRNCKLAWVADKECCCEFRYFLAKRIAVVDFENKVHTYTIQDWYKTVICTISWNPMCVKNFILQVLLSIPCNEFTITWIMVILAFQVFFLIFLKPLILLKKISVCGVVRFVLSWFQSYSTNKIHFVSLDNGNFGIPSFFFNFIG